MTVEWKKMSLAFGLGWVLAGCTVEIPEAFYAAEGTPVEDGKVAGNEDASGAEAVSCTTDEECALPEGEDGGCVTYSCGDEGACVAQYAETGTVCESDGATAGVCEGYTCNGTGQCALSDLPEGSVCEGEDAIPCGAFTCQSGECKTAETVCDDGAKCSMDWCIVHAPCTVSATNPTTASVLGCQFEMTTGPSDAPSSYTLNPLLQNSEVRVSWCNPEYANEGPHNGNGCLPDEKWSDFVVGLAPVDGGIEGGACRNVPFASGNPNFCDDLNSCTTDECIAGDPESDPISGCRFTTVLPGTPCSGREACFSKAGEEGDLGTCYDVQGTLQCVADPGVNQNCEAENKEANTNPCVTAFTCNSAVGTCERSASWQSGEDVPLCNVEEGQLGTSVAVGGSCGTGKCEACGPNEPGCDGAKCVPRSYLGMSCEGPDSCQMNNGESLGCTSDGACEQPCFLWQKSCTDCRKGVGTPAEEAKLAIFLNAFFFEAMDEGDFYESYLQDGLWAEIAQVCQTKLLPGALNADAYETMKPDAFEAAFYSCVKGVVTQSTLPSAETFRTKLEPKLEDFFAAAASAFYKLLPEFGICENCATAVLSCDNLSSFGDEGLKAQCSDKFDLDPVIFGSEEGFGYKAPYCVRLCLEKEAPDSACLMGACSAL